MSFTVATAPGVSHHYADVHLYGIPFIGEMNGHNVDANFANVCP